MITDDAETMYHYGDELRRRGVLNLRPIKLQDGFSLEPFTADGQTDFSQVLEAAAEYDTSET